MLINDQKLILLRCGPCLLAIEKGRCDINSGAGRGTPPPNMAHVRQGRPNLGHDFHVQVIKTFQVVPCSLGSGTGGMVRSTRHTVEFEAFGASDMQGSRDQIFTAQGPKVNSVCQVDS
jgi:hypothetical protein